MIAIRRARPSDAPSIAAVHVATWRSTYAGVLPDAFLARLSVVRHAAGYEQAITDRRDGHAVFVAVASGPDAPAGQERREGGVVIGFASGGRARRPGLGEGEIETLYVLDDYRDRGLGRRLMRAMAAHLAAIGCRSAVLWVLEANPTRWFYLRLGGRHVARETICYAGITLEQLAFAWNPIKVLLAATAPVREI
jgi:hypothetical protein